MKKRDEELIFFQPRPGVAMTAQAIWDLFRTAGKWRESGEDLLAPLPVQEILAGIQALPGWEEDGLEEPDRYSLRFKTEDGAGTAAVFWYGQKPGMVRDRILCLYCRGLTEAQVSGLVKCMAGLNVPMQLREDHGWMEA